MSHFLSTKGNEQDSSVLIISLRSAIVVFGCIMTSPMIFVDLDASSRYTLTPITEGLRDNGAIDILADSLAGAASRSTELALRKQVSEKERNREKERWGKTVGSEYWVQRRPSSQKPTQNQTHEWRATMNVRTFSFSSSYILHS